MIIKVSLNLGYSEYNCFGIFKASFSYSRRVVCIVFTGYKLLHFCWETVEKRYKSDQRSLSVSSVSLKNKRGVYNL